MNLPPPGKSNSIYFFWGGGRAVPHAHSPTRDPGIEPLGPLHWERRVLTTGLPGKSLFFFLVCLIR